MIDEELIKVIEKAANNRLEYLDLSDRGLTLIPKEIGQLTCLNWLILSKNQLVSLPEEIGLLTNLNTLNISDNKLTSLPPEIFQLTNLRWLYLSHNKLKILPAEFINLNCLTRLSLDHNEITVLPKEIFKLKNLIWLDFSHNRIIDLPPEIGQLDCLNTLDISNNQLIFLPPEIGQLYGLREFNINNNLLKKITPEIGNLTYLKIFRFQDNLELDIPPEISGKKTEQVIYFYRQKLEQETDKIYEAKLLIIGEGDAGKTTLAGKIRFLNYQLKEEDSTRGITIAPWKFTLDNGEEFRVNIWDFGGQEIYHTTHQFFLTKRSLYTLVIDARKEDTDFHYWLNIVQLLSDNSPLLIIKNEKQERQKEINENQLRSEFDNLKETLSTNFATDRGLPEILKAIQYYISKLPHIGNELPKSWIKVREALEQDQRNYLGLDEYFSICESNGFTRREDKLQLSDYLHDLGVCLHFQEDNLLRKTVILKPTWGTDAVYKVLDNPKVIKNQGRFTYNDLRNIWHEEKYALMQPELLQLMMNFKLCYEIPNSKTYIAPQWLTPNQPDYVWDESDNLLLRYEYEFMPKGIITRFIVEMHTWIKEQSYVWKSGVILSKNDAKAEVIERYRYYKGEIRIRVSGNYPRDLLTTIRHELDKIHNSYNFQDNQPNKVQRLKYKTLVPCNCSSCKPSQNPYFYQLNNLYNFKKKIF
jgi:internalin A